MEDKVDYSYQKDIFNLLPNYEKELLDFSNNDNENKTIKNNLYKRFKKLVFSWNGMWSNRDLFYENMNSNKIQFKIINHYSKSFMKPLTAPIFDIDYYLPEFSDFEKEKLFNKETNKDNPDNNNYFDLIFNIDKIFEISKINKENINTNTNSNLIIEKTQNEESDENKNYLKQIYHKLDPKLYVYYRKISCSLHFANNEKNPTNNNITENNSNISDNKNNLVNNNNNNYSKKSTATSSNSDNGKKRAYTTAINDLGSGKSYTFSQVNYYLCCLVKTTHHIKGVFFLENESINFRLFSDQKTGKKTMLVRMW